MADELLHDVPAIMERLRVGRSTVFDEMASGRLRSIKIGRRRLVSETALCDYIAELDRQAATL
jgi:excisionase family DNA binding protein